MFLPIGLTRATEGRESGAWSGLRRARADRSFRNTLEQGGKETHLPAACHATKIKLMRWSQTVA